MHTPLVFIGMPLYNGERHLKEAINSLLNQSFSDFVLFISDDQSKDGTEQICRDFAAQDPRVIYHRQQKNIGMYENFKFVLEKADGKYFMWAAQDDVRGKEYLAVSVDALEQDEHIGLATTTTVLIDEVGSELAVEEDMRSLSAKPSIRQVARYTLQPEGLGKCNLTYGLFRTEVARAVWHAYPWRRVWGHDYHFVLALVSRFKIHVDPQTLFYKRLGGISSPELARELKALSFKARRNDFPFRRFSTYFEGHMEALRGTPYQLVVGILLLLRLPRIFIFYLTDRNYRKFLKNLSAGLFSL